MLPNERTTVITGFTEKTVAEVLAGKHPAEMKPLCYMMEAYKETPVFVTIDITEDVFELVARKISGSAGPGCTDSEALQGWLLKFRDHSKKNFV